jgi:hypothetical protein
MSIEIQTVTTSLTVDAPPSPTRGRARTAGPIGITLEIYRYGCRVWSDTECGEFFSFEPGESPEFPGKRPCEMKFADQVYRHLAGEYAARRKGPVGDFLQPAVRAFDSDFASKHGSSVYFAQAGGRVKVGWSKQVSTRISQLQTGSAEPIKLLGVTPGARSSDPRSGEPLMYFALSGEWFTATPELLAYIREATV